MVLASDSMARIRSSLLLGVALLVGGCGALGTGAGTGGSGGAGAAGAGGAPAASPSDFGSFAATLSAQGVQITNVVAGDPGCSDRTLAPTAISFRAAGLGQATPVTARVYLFGSGASYDRLRQSVDTCARSFITDPATYVSIDASPYVLVGQGPWAPPLQAALKLALEGAAAGH